MSSESTSTLPSAKSDAGPQPEWSFAPLTLAMLCALMGFWGMVYLNDHGGGFNGKVYGPYQSFEIVMEKQPKLTGPEGQIAEGKKVFRANCEVCHQATGIGSPANGCPPLVGSEWVVGVGPNRIIRLVLQGGSGPITVKGQQYPGTTQMTPFKATLDDQQIADVLSYIRNEWGNKADVVDPKKVKAIRTEETTKVGPFTPDQLLKISDKD